MKDMLVRDIRRLTTMMDRDLGSAATYRVSPAGASTAVFVRSKPIGIRERTDLSQAGLTDVDAVWFLQTTYIANVLPGHILEVPVGGFKYEVKTATKDELDIEWTIFTRRIRM
jgi:hypothetical protein